MKRFLLSVFLTGLFVYGQAQSMPEMIINEVYVDPATGAHEFVELNNTSNEWKNTDCYQLVVFFNNANGNPKEKGFYVLDFPSINVQPGGYVVGAANNPFNYQKFKNTNADFNWNTFQDKAGNVIPGGSLKKYIECSSCPGGYDIIGDGIPAEEKAFVTTDLFYANKDNQTGGIRYGIFLFNNGTFVNGLLGGFNAGELTAELKLMPALPLTPNCSTSDPKSINWNTLPANEFVIAASGNTDNGYIRKYDGICGEWEKSSSTGDTGGEHTPGRTNGFSDRDPNGLTTTAQYSVCGNRIEITLTGAKYNYVFPVTVLLYEDKPELGKLGADDVFLTYETITSASSAYIIIDKYPNPAYITDNTQPQYLPLDPTKNYLLVYKTALGCLDRIIRPSLPSLLTTQINFCGDQIDISLTGGTGSDAASYLPVNVYIYHDANNNGEADAGEALIPGTPFPVTDYSALATPFTLPDGYKDLGNYLIVYESTNVACVSKKVKAAQAKGSVATAQTRFCGSPNSVTYNVTGVTGDAKSEYVLPVVVSLYLDKGTPEVYDDGVDELIDSKTIENFAEGQQIFNFTLADPYAPLIIVYRTKFDCLGKVFPLPSTCTPLPVHFTTFTATRKQKRVALEWKTATEVNNNGFYVQRNINGEWKDIAFVFSQAENGNSSALLTYSYNDNNDAKGLSQYRILQVDKSGKGTYSEVRAVRGEVQSSKIMVYPNPSTNGAVNVLFEEGSSAKDVQVSDVMGRVIKAYQNVTSTSLVIENLSDGFYTIQITDRHTAASTVEKVVVKKR